LIRDILDPLTYGRIAYLALAFVLGVVHFTFLVTALSVGVSLAVTLIGIPILIWTVYAWRWLAQLERRLIAALTGVHIPSPYRQTPPGANWWGKLHSRLADPATWKDLVFLFLQFPVGIVSFVLVTVVLGTGLAALLAPAYYWAVEDGLELGLFEIDTLIEAVAVVPVGVLILFLGIPALGALGKLYGHLAALLLGSNADPELTAQVTDLQDARSRIIAAADAERRRIERDLHDGAQQRLVALALQLRMAESRAQSGDPEAAKLIHGAGEEASLALAELRDLARGIHPAILTNRGLAAALDDLAARATVPVEVLEAPHERLPDEVEAAAYFVVSECLANVAKHAQASSATVRVRADSGRLIVEVADDGTGGVEAGNGSGLQGLEDRVGALDGSLSLVSPAGGGTRVTARIPLSPPEPESELAALVRRPVLPDAEADARQARRRRNLWARESVLAVIALTLIVLWVLTGTENPWIPWPLLGLGLVAGLDAWIVLAGPPLKESDLSGEGDRREETRALRRRRRMRIDGGALVILNLFLVGVWLAGGAGYFWPVWPMLGCAAAFALKTLRWPALMRERLTGEAPEDLAH
jgi:signal transduction histidine kinase